MQRFPSMPDLQPPGLAQTIPFNYTARQTLVTNHDFLENSFGKPSLRAHSTANSQNTNNKNQYISISLPKEPIVRTNINQHEININKINQVQLHRVPNCIIQPPVPVPIPVAFPTSIIKNKYNPSQVSPRNINIHFISPQTNQQTLHKTNILKYQQPVRPSNIGDNQRIRQVREPRTSINFVQSEK